MASIPVTRFTRQELQTIDQAIEHLTNNYVNKINAQDLSDTFNIPIKKLQAGVIRRTGLTIHAYVEAVRLNKAKELLAADGPIKCIPELVGYRSPSQFGFFFKKHTGHTPLEYRRILTDT